jgi:hypothetical protein
MMIAHFIVSQELDYSTARADTAWQPRSGVNVVGQHSAAEDGDRSIAAMPAE